MGKRKGKGTGRAELFAIWLDGRRLTPGAFPLADAIALLGAATRRWERENASATTQLGAVRAADGSLYLCAPLVLRRDSGASLTDDDWEIVRMLERQARERPWAARSPRSADKAVAQWLWSNAPRRMEPDEDALDSSGLFG